MNPALIMKLPLVFIAVLLCALLPSMGSAQEVPLSPANAVASHAKTSLPPDLVSVREFGGVCDGVTNVAGAVASAILNGHRRIWLPSMCLYIPPNNTTPADTEIFGEDWRTSVISVAERAADQLLYGPRSRLHNVAIISKFCDQTAAPRDVRKVCPLANGINIGDVSNPITNWAFASFNAVAGPKITGPNGAATTDTQILGLNSSMPGGDVLYLGTQSTGTSAIREVTMGNGDVGTQCFSGLSDGSVPNNYVHQCLLILENSSSPQSHSIHVNRSGDSNSILIDDSGDKEHTSDLIDIGLSRQSGGSVINIFHTGTNYYGDLIHFNLGNQAKISGNLIAYDRHINGHADRVLNVDLSGNIETAGNGHFGENILSNGVIAAKSLDIDGVTVVDEHRNVTARHLTVKDVLALPRYTVATLPDCSTFNAETIASVIDAASPTWGALVNGGGSTPEPVFCDGVSWRIH